MILKLPFDVSRRKIQPSTVSVGNETSELLPTTVNHTERLFRAMLWIAPPGYAISSLAGSVWLQKVWLFPSFNPWIWLLSYITFVIGTGYYSARLSPLRRLQPNGVPRQIAMFCAVHLLLVPLVLVGVGVILLMKNGFHISC